MICAYAREVQPFPWGTPLEKVQSDLMTNGSIESFNPTNRSGYTNKVMSYILAVDENIGSDMVVLSHKSGYTRDYLFIQGRLSTTMEDFGQISGETMNMIIRDLKRRYGEPSSQSEGGLTIDSWSDNKSKVMLYRKKLDNGRYKSKLYLYDRALFRKLILG
jgi:hypothetical protein